MPHPDFAPGLMVIHGNHPEGLRDLLVAWMQRYPLPPLDNETVLVQSNGIAQWLKLALAADVSQGGCGIAAALDAQLPARFLWQAYRAVLGEAAVPEVSPFDKSRLVWRLMRLLPEVLPQPGFEALAQFLAGDDDLRKRHQLAQRLADLFDQYQVYRADWLADWAAGRDELATSRGGRVALNAAQCWQPALWRALLDDVGPALRGSGRAAVHSAFLAAVPALPDAPRPPGLPRRVLVFGISSMPRQALEVLSAIARWSQVLLCVHNPCEHYWADIIADKDLLRAPRSSQARKAGRPEVLRDEDLHRHAHPLLAAWGKQGRDFIGLLDEHDARDDTQRQAWDVSERINLFDSPGDDCVLHQLQDDIRELRALADTRTLWPPVDPAFDTSIRFHVAHSPQREVEILHDQLLAAFDAGTGLRPRDVIVMVPDIDAYAPHIQAVFGQRDRGDKRFVPYTVADRGLRHHDALLNAVEKLLGLPQSRLAASDLLDLLEVPALRARFGIEAGQVPLLHRWIRSANIRWGLHAEQRASLGLSQASGQHTWAFGLRRMLLGYAAGAGEAWHDIEPFDEVGGLEAALVGALARLLHQLEATWQQLCEPTTVDDWCDRLRTLLSDYFAATEADDGYTLVRLETALQQWCEASGEAGLTEVLPLSVVREHWLSQLDQPTLSQRFFAGAVTFATLMPMRAIPFRHVCLLGMNDGDYPRARVTMDFDLMAADYRPGDRSRREDDRYLFLEALLSAREHLHISWVGRSINDNSPRPPSVLVGQLRDHLLAGWALDDDSEAAAAGQDLLSAFTVQHPLQPFSRAYFPRDDAGETSPFFTYAREWREGLAGAAEGVTAVAAAPLPAPQWAGPLTLRTLTDFLSDPVRAFLTQRLDVHLTPPDAAADDHEPFALDGLETWRLQNELIGVQVLALSRGEPREDALTAQLARISRRGDLAAGHFADVMCEALAEPMDVLFEDYGQALARFPLGPEPPQAIQRDHPTGLPALALSDWLTDVRRNADGRRGRVLLESTSLVRQQFYRRDKMIRYWVGHLAGHLDGEPMTTIVVGKPGVITLPELDVAQARQAFDGLMSAWYEGLHQPLPLAPQSGLAWLERHGKPDDSIDSLAGATARARYEQEDTFGGVSSERQRSPYLHRAYPDFDALWAGGAFVQWTHALLGPLYDAIEAGKPVAAAARRAAAGADASSVPGTTTSPP